MGPEAASACPDNPKRPAPGYPGRWQPEEERNDKRMPTSERAIVIGASAGGVETLKEVVARLPEDLPAPVFVVLHIPPYVASSLPEILSKAGPLPAVHPKDGTKVR